MSRPRNFNKRYIGPPMKRAELCRQVLTNGLLRGVGEPHVSWREGDPWSFGYQFVKNTRMRHSEFNEMRPSASVWERPDGKLVELEGYVI